MNLKDIKLLSLLLGLILVVSGCTTAETVEQPIVELEPAIVAEQQPEVDPVPVVEEPEPLLLNQQTQLTTKVIHYLMPAVVVHQEVVKQMLKSTLDMTVIMLFVITTDILMTLDN